MATKNESELASIATLSSNVREGDWRAAQAATAFFLMQEYGPVMDGPALVKALRYPTLTALERSLQRGHLKIKTLDLPGRRGTFVHAYELAKYLSDRMADIEVGPNERTAATQKNDLKKKGGRKK